MATKSEHTATAKIAVSAEPSTAVNVEVEEAEEEEEEEEETTPYMDAISAKQSNIQQAFNALKDMGYFAELDVMCCSTCANAEIYSQVKQREKDGVEPWKGFLYTHEQVMTGIRDQLHWKKADDDKKSVTENEDKAFDCKGIWLYHDFKGDETVRDAALQVLTEFGCEPVYEGHHKAINFTYQSTAEPNASVDWRAVHEQKMKADVRDVGTAVSTASPAC